MTFLRCVISLRNRSGERDRCQLRENLPSTHTATPIGGTFSNLPDGSAFTVGSNTFQANYEGGSGNDLTLGVQ